MRISNRLEKYFAVCAAVVGLAAAGCLSGCCCSEWDKRSLREMTDRAIERNVESCRSITDETKRVACNACLLTQQNRLIEIYVNFLFTCANGNNKLIQVDHDAFLAACVSNSPSADVNHDGQVNSSDNDVFMDRWNYWRQP